MKKVLVADDEIEIQGLVANFLRNYGVHVEGVGNGIQACKRLQETTFDLIITDLNMPGEDGCSVIYKSRNFLKSTRTTPIIIITGAGNANDFEMVNENLAQHKIKILLKPFSLDDLLNNVCESLHLDVTKVNETMMIE